MLLEMLLLPVVVQMMHGEGRNKGLNGQRSRAALWGRRRLGRSNGTDAVQRWLCLLRPLTFLAAATTAALSSTARRRRYATLTGCIVRCRRRRRRIRAFDLVLCVWRVCFCHMADLALRIGRVSTRADCVSLLGSTL